MPRMSLLDELELREAEEYLNSPTAKILGATPEARLLVTRSRKQLEEAKRRHAEELEEARQRAREEERLHKAESERVKLLLEKRKRERIFGAMVFVLGIIMLVLPFGFYINEKRKDYLASKEQVRSFERRGKTFREKAKADLVDGTNPIRNIHALRNLSLALNSSRQDTEAAKMARKLLLQRVWCPPAAPEVRYRQDALLAATFAPGGSNNEIFAVVGNGQLLVLERAQACHPSGPYLRSQNRPTFSRSCNLASPP